MIQDSIWLAKFFSLWNLIFVYFNKKQLRMIVLIFSWKINSLKATRKRKCFNQLILDRFQVYKIFLKWMLCSKTFLIHLSLSFFFRNSLLFQQKTHTLANRTLRLFCFRKKFSQNLEIPFFTLNRQRWNANVILCNEMYDFFFCLYDFETFPKKKCSPI